MGVIYFVTMFILQSAFSNIYVGVIRSYIYVTTYNPNINVVSRMLMRIPLLVSIQYIP